MDSALSLYKAKLRGIVACILVVLASKFLSLNFGAPTMLFPLILGMSVNFLYESEYSIPGIDFCLTTILCFGVILLGLKNIFGNVLALGSQTRLSLWNAIWRCCGNMWHRCRHDLVLYNVKLAI